MSSSPAAKIALSKIDPAAKPVASRDEAEREIEQLRERLLELQQALYAEHKRSLLIVIQAMDTGGKDGAIKKICSGLDPNGVHLTNFKFPSAEEWDHDFLWRVHHAAPRKGVIGIWNRSHYEDVLVPRVHKQISEQVWRERCEDINAFERLLSSQRRTSAEILPPHFEGRTEGTTRSATARSEQALEVQHGRPEGARALGRVPDRL